MQLNAICYPKGGPTMGFAVPVTGRNAELLRQAACRIEGLEDARRNLRATLLFAEECATDQLSVIARPSALRAVDFNFNKVCFDCSSGAVPNVQFCDTRRERTLRIDMSVPDIEKCVALAAQDNLCGFCSNTLTETEILKGEGTCIPCVVPAAVVHAKSADDPVEPVRPTFVCAHCGAPMIIVQTIVRGQPIRAPPHVPGAP